MLAGNALFLAASLVCGVAWDGPALWASRAAQGVGAAFVITGAIALLASTYSRPEDRARAFGVMGIVSGIAMALGPTLGGAISAWLSWRWIFLANVPLCMVIAWTVPRLVHESRDVHERPLDHAGIVLLTLALGLIIASLLEAQDAPVHAALGLLASAVLMALFVVQQRRRGRPMFDLSIFAQKVMIGIVSLLFAVSSGYWAVLVYLPLYLRTAFGWQSQGAGLALMIATLPMLALPAIGGHLAAGWGWRRLFASGLAIMVMGDLLLAGSSLRPDDATRLAMAVLGMLCTGTGAALAHPQLSGAVVSLIPPDQAGMASAMTVIARQAGFAIGIAALGAMLSDATVVQGFVSPFLLATATAAAGLWAALGLLPAPPRKAIGH
jgi:MFS family permease